MEITSFSAVYIHMFITCTSETPPQHSLACQIDFSVQNKSLVILRKNKYFKQTCLQFTLIGFSSKTKQILQIGDVDSNFFSF